MKRWEQLALRAMDNELTAEEAAELDEYLRDETLCASWTEWLRVEALLRSRGTPRGLRQKTLAKLRSEFKSASVAEQKATQMPQEPGRAVSQKGSKLFSCRQLTICLVCTAVAVCTATCAVFLARHLILRSPTTSQKLPPPGERGGLIVSSSPPPAWAVKMHPHWPPGSVFRAWYFDPKLGGPVMRTSPDGEQWSEPTRLRGVRADTSELAVLFEPEHSKPFRLYHLRAGPYRTEICAASSSDGINFDEDHQVVHALYYGARGLAVAHLPGDILPYRLFYEDALSGRIVYACSPDGNSFAGVDFIKIEDAPMVRGLTPLSMSRSIRGHWQLWVANTVGDTATLTSTNCFLWRLMNSESSIHIPSSSHALKPLAPTSGSWDFFSPMQDWRTEGWLAFTTSGNTPDGETTAIVQNQDGTVSVRDRRPWGNFYLTHDAVWTVPFTIELRVRLEEATGNDADADFPKFTVAAMMRDPRVHGPQAWQPAFALDRFGAWDLQSGPSVQCDIGRYQTFTIVCRFDQAAEQRLRNGSSDPDTLQALCVFDVYVNRDFKAPAFSYHNTGFPGWGSVDADGRLDIGFPWPSAGQLTLDWVRWGKGVILDPVDPRETSLPMLVHSSLDSDRFSECQVADCPNGPWMSVFQSSKRSVMPVFGLAQFYRYVPTRKSPP